MPTNTIVRGRIFHFRRVVPADLRGRIGRAELTCSLGTADLGLAERWSRQLYLAAADLFAGVRQDAILWEGQLAEIVQDFSSYLLDEDNRARLKSATRSDVSSDLSTQPNVGNTSPKRDMPD